MKKTPYNPADYTVPSFDTFPEFLTGITELYGQRPALSWFTRRKEEQTLTYAQLAEKVSSLRKAILAKQLPKGSHIAILSENTADWIIAFLATVSCGHVAVCADTEQSDGIIREMLCRSKARLVFLSGTFLSICLPLLDSNDVSSMVLMDGKATDERARTRACSGLPRSDRGDRVHLRHHQPVQDGHAQPEGHHAELL